MHGKIRRSAHIHRLERVSLISLLHFSIFISIFDWSPFTGFFLLILPCFTLNIVWTHTQKKRFSPSLIAFERICYRSNEFHYFSWPFLCFRFFLKKKDVALPSLTFYYFVLRTGYCCKPTFYVCLHIFQYD